MLTPRPDQQIMLGLGVMHRNGEQKTFESSAATMRCELCVENEMRVCMLPTPSEFLIRNVFLILYFISSCCSICNAG